MKLTEMQLVQNLIEHMYGIKGAMDLLKSEGYDVYLSRTDSHLSHEKTKKEDKLYCNKVALSCGVVELAEALGLEWYQEDDEIYFIYDGVCFYQLGQPTKPEVSYTFKKKGETRD